MQTEEKTPKATAIVKINASDYGLEEKKASQISDMFKPMLDEMVELEQEYNEVAKLEISEETCAKAKELRLKYVKVRTGTAAIHKELKSFYLQGGRFVDGWKNAQLMASEGIEEKLTDIEKHFENIELQKVAKLQENRSEEMRKHKPQDEWPFIPDNLGTMEESVWDSYILGVKTEHTNRLEAAKKLEVERAEIIRLNKIEEERRIEVAPYVQWNETKKSLRLYSDEEYQELLTLLRQAKKDHDDEQEKTRVENERLKKEAEQKEKAQEAERKKKEAELQKEREKTEKAQLELKKKNEEEERQKQEQLTALQEELKKGDSDKIKDLVSDLQGLKTKYEFKAQKTKKMYGDVGLLIDKVVDHINS